MSNSIGRCLKKIWSKRIVRNIILFFPMLFIVTLISFAVVYYAPGDAATLLLKENLQAKKKLKNMVKKLTSMAVLPNFIVNGYPVY